MKKGKITLVLITIMGIIGGIVAFKTSEYGTKRYYITNHYPVRAYVPLLSGYITATGPQYFWTTVYGSYAINWNPIASGL